jgi:release factor glutamine methyltransferase
VVGSPRQSIVQTMMVGQWLDHLRQEIAPLSDSANLDAQVLLAHVLEQSRAWVLAHQEVQLSLEQESALLTALEQLKNGVALPYILGVWQFYGLEFIVSPDTLIPRPETELLVETALDWLATHPERRWCVDVGTGSGCIAVTLAKHVPGLQVLASDHSLSALRVAQENAIRHQVVGRVKFVQSDLLAAFGEGFDLICANLPYIPSRDLHSLDVARREPLNALDGGYDGLELIRILLEAAPAVIAPDGILLLEIGADQAEAARTIARRNFPECELRVLKDLAGRERVLQVVNIKSG